MRLLSSRALPTFLRSPRRSTLILLTLTFLLLLLLRHHLAVLPSLLRMYTFPLLSNSYLGQTPSDGFDWTFEWARSPILDYHNMTPSALAALPRPTNPTAPKDDGKPIPLLFHSLLLIDKPMPNGTFLEMRPNWVRARESCMRHHPDATFLLWSDANATEFVKREYPDVADSWLNYAQPIQKANILRYLVVHVSVRPRPSSRARRELNFFLPVI